MTRPVALLAILLLMPALSLAQQVTFTMKAPPVGLTRSSVDSMSVVALISVNAEGMDQAFDMANSERKTYSETVLAVNDGKVTRKRVAVSEAIERTAQPMQPVSSKTAPVVGKTYILEHIGDSVSVIGEDGAIVPKEERAFMVKEFSRDTEGQFSKILNGRSMSVGEELELKDELLSEFGASMTDGGMKLRSAKITLRSVGETQGRQTALLGLDVVMSGAQGPMEMEIKLTGTAEVGVDTLWPLSLVMTGTLSGAGNHGGADLTADGDMKLARIATYE